MIPFITYITHKDPQEDSEEGIESEEGSESESYSESASDGEVPVMKTPGAKIMKNPAGKNQHKKAAPTRSKFQTEQKAASNTKAYFTFERD